MNEMTDDSGSFRNFIAHRICNWALNTIATPYYREFIGGSIEYGMRAAARDSQTGATPPPDWRDQP